MAVRLLAALAAALVTAGAAVANGTNEVERLPTAKKLVALTFDGGGDTASGLPLILKTLRRDRVTATFFLAGRWIRLHPQLARALGRGYPVGNHTFDHADLTHLSTADARRDITLGAWWVRAGTGRTTKPLFRFPYGARDTRTLEIVRTLGYVSVRWSIDTWGWMGVAEGQSVDSVVRRFEEHLQPGAIVLMHLGAARDGSILDAKALPQLIEAARARGYRFVALDRWIRAPK